MLLLHFNVMGYVCLSFKYGIGWSTVCSTLKESCKALREVLMREYVEVPVPISEWEGASHQFGKIWNFPNCIGQLNMPAKLSFYYIF